MKQTLLHKLCIALFLVFVTAPKIYASTSGTNSVQTFNTGWQQVERIGYNDCTAENVLFAGMELDELQIKEDASGGTHFLNIVRIMGTFEGLVTGAKYMIASAGGTFTEYSANAVNGTYMLSVPYKNVAISLDKQYPDVFFNLLIHMTLDASGNLRSSIENFEIICR